MNILSVFALGFMALGFIGYLTCRANLEFYCDSIALIFLGGLVLESNLSPTLTIPYSLAVILMIFYHWEHGYFSNS